MADPSDYQKDPRPAPQSQLSTSLPGVTTYITTHDASTGKAKLHSTREGKWNHLDDNQVGVNPVYNSGFHADLSDEKDLQESDALIEKGLGLVREGGTNCFHVDLSPGYEYKMHRTQSVDYGIVVEGQVEMGLEDGSKTLMRIGDVAVQRGTLHSWKNPSKEQWARMIFILQSTKPVKVDGKELKPE